MSRRWPIARILTTSMGGMLATLVFVSVLASGPAVSAQQWYPRHSPIDDFGMGTVGAGTPNFDVRSPSELNVGRPAYLVSGMPADPSAAPTTFTSQRPILIDPGPPIPREEPWSWQVLPDGLIYRSYLAGAREPRLATVWVHERELGWIWDIALGGRVGVLRYGTTDEDRPEGWQIDVEGAGLPRLDLENERDLVAIDFRAGFPITYGRGRYQTKFGYYHLSSHLGDEYMVRHQSFSRINFVREVLFWGHSFYWTDDLRLYGEAAWAFTTDGGSEPWEFQFGVDYSPARPSGRRGSPFFAVNAHLREEVDFGGNLVVQTGWQWRGNSGHLFRTGMQYYTGKSEQYQFFDQHEDKIGLGIWYDF